MQPAFLLTFSAIVPCVAEVYCDIFREDSTGRKQALDKLWLNLIFRLVIPVVMAGIFIAILAFNHRKKH
jgi:Na+/H+-dicarboxylate symporter